MIRDRSYRWAIIGLFLVIAGWVAVSTDQYLEESHKIVFE
jgi:hypothetical protein